MSALEKFLVCAQLPEAACGSGMGLGRGSGPALFLSCTQQAFIACMLSLLLHLQRKYLGYFCRGDVTVWLHEHLHGFEEVRAAGTSERSHRPWVQCGWLWSLASRDREEEEEQPQVGGESVFLMGHVGFGGLVGIQGLSPGKMEECSSVERLVLKSRRVETWDVKPVEDLFVFWLVLESLVLFKLGKAGELILTRGPHPHV